MTDQTQPTGSPISDELADTILAVKERGVPCPPNCDYQTHRRAEMRAVLEAALPHLRPLVAAQELRLATEVALKLGREEMREEIAAKADEIARGHSKSAEEHRAIAIEVGGLLPRGKSHMATARAFSHKADGAYEVAHAARDTGKGNSA